jgi:hypothetical protein
LTCGGVSRESFGEEWLVFRVNPLDIPQQIACGEL